MTSLRPRTPVLGLAITPFLITSCETNQFVATGPTYPPYAADCTFELLTSDPPPDCVQIGILDMIAPPAADAGMFMREIQHNVCAAGGDVVVAQISDTGHYVSATVYRRSEATSKTSGCQYDTQCKGDRICVNGACANPD